MKSIGAILKNARVEKGLKLSGLADVTKIKSSFISSIENEDWDKLPPFPIVLGFVKSLSATLKIDETVAVATLKRDYPPKKVRITPKPDVSSKFLWSPKFTFIVGIATLVLILFGYLSFQYVKFSSPPRIYLESPKENQLVNEKSVTVFGVTDSDVKIVINNQPVLVSDDGKFSVNLDVSENTKEITVIGTSRSGKETVIHRKIIVEQNG